MNITEAELAAMKQPPPPRTKHDRVLEASLKLIEIVEGVRNDRWCSPGGKRLKDTPEWVEFYLATSPFRR